MKIKKIAQLCKQEGWAELVNYTDRSGCVQQWITDGRALYPVEGLPYLRAENLPSLLELNDKQKDAMRIREREAPPSICFLDTADGEKAAVRQSVSVNYEGRELMPLVVSGVGVRWVDRALLAPILAEYENVELTLRAPAGCRELIAAKAGFMLVGLIAPETGTDELRRLLLAIVE